jgi:hypothetical protein
MPAAALRQPEPAPSRSPEREPLADAIERHRSAVEYLTKLDTAEHRHLELRRDEWRAVEEAEAAVAKAQAAEPGRAAAALLGEKVGLVSLASAEAALAAAKAQDAEGTARGLALRQRTTDARQEVESARRGLDDAKGAVVASSSELAAIAAAYLQHRIQCAVIAELFQERFGGFHFVLPDTVCRAAHYTVGRDHEAVAPLAKAALGAWRAALVALEVDPDAALAGDDDAA